MSDQRSRGFWYWLVAVSPLSYFLAKATGDPAAREDAHAAVQVAGRFWIAVAAVLLVGLVVYGVGMAAGVW